MEDLRKKRLLLIAQTASCDHKYWYPQYLELQAEGYIRWVMGTAFLTTLGMQKLKEYMRE